MKIYKFGGASVRDAAGVRNVSDIVTAADGRLVVVVSAMGKTTNALETLVDAFFSGRHDECAGIVAALSDSHLRAADELMGADSPCHAALRSLLARLAEKVAGQPSLNYDFEYDQIICYGELLSSVIVSHYLNSIGRPARWVDIRTALKTDDNYRDARIDWQLSATFVPDAFAGADVCVTQGFIGSTINNLTTTLGREGSDYSAAIIGHILDAESVTIWKDVPGVMSSDPRWYPDAQFLPRLSYWEAIEMTYFGANVIHPKTLKPLQNKNIPLRVRSFVNPGAEGTVISSFDNSDSLPPMLILRRNQIFISMSPKDFSFIMEDNLSQIFSIFSRHKVKINLLQNSALNFSVCIDNTPKLPALLDELGRSYNTRYNDDLELLNIRHYDAATLASVISGKTIIDSQVTRKTARYVVKASPWNFRQS